MIYWDHNATSPLRPRVKKRMAEALEFETANPNSSHTLGQTARNYIEQARRTIANAIGAKPQELVIGASATECNLMALYGLFLARNKANPQAKKIVASPIEHSSVHENIKILGDRLGAEIVFLKTDRNGIVDLNHLRDLVKDSSVALVSVMGAHNETGVLQPWLEISKICAEQKIPYHCDLVQYFGRFAFNLDQSGVATATVSFHKAGGPKGVSILYIRTGVQCESIICGGGQEKKRRAGTENLLAIMGAEAVCEETEELQKIHQTQIKELRDYFETELTKALPQIEIVGHAANRLCNTSFVVFRGVKSDALMMNLDINGCCVGTGSACGSGMLLPSRTLLALGYSKDDAVSAIRFSFGPSNTLDEVKAILPCIEKAVKKMAAA